MNNNRNVSDKALARKMADLCLARCRKTVRSGAAFTAVSTLVAGLLVSAPGLYQKGSWKK